MILVVTYDLKGLDKSYSDFYDTLKKQGGWWHYLKSTWLLSTDKNPQQVFEELRPHLYLESGDRIFIASIEDNYYGWLPKDAWEWINKHKKQLSRK